MPIPLPRHRHQTSLEGVIDVLASTQRLSPERRDQATHIFNALIKACEPFQPNSGPYKQITLVANLYQTRRDESQLSADDHGADYYFAASLRPGADSFLQKSIVIGRPMDQALELWRDLQLSLLRYGYSDDH